VVVTENYLGVEGLIILASEELIITPNYLSNMEGYPSI